jgi:hypothetical protein
MTYLSHRYMAGQSHMSRATSESGLNWLKPLWGAILTMRLLNRTVNVSP